MVIFPVFFLTFLLYFFFVFYWTLFLSLDFHGQSLNRMDSERIVVPSSPHSSVFLPLLHSLSSGLQIPASGQVSRSGCLLCSNTVCSVYLFIEKTNCFWAGEGTRCQLQRSGPLRDKREGNFGHFSMVKVALKWTNISKLFKFL